MALSAISAFLDTKGSLPSKPVCTFVLAGGCNLSCSFCAIKMRNERQELEKFNSHQYRDFVVNSRHQISGVAVVGDEPLLPQAWESTQKILEAAKEARLPSAIVTNGTFLAERCADLSKLDVSTILVSVDGDEKLHDHIRGKEGTFRKINAGLNESKLFPSLHESIVVTSVMLPNKVSDLPDLVNSLLIPNDIKKWALSPLLIFDQDNGVANIHPKLLQQLQHKLPELIEYATKNGIQLSLDDSFNIIPSYSEFLDTYRLGPKLITTNSSQVMRISADGSVSLHGQRFKMSSKSKFRWDGKCDAKSLLDSIQDDIDIWHTEAA